jgi:hypothetical protein
VGYLDPFIDNPLTFTVNLSNPVNATLAPGHSTGTAMVVPYLYVNGDQEPVSNLYSGVTNPANAAQVPPFVTIGPAQLTASTGGATDATFMLSLSHAFDQTVVVEYRTADDTAVAGSDYVAAPTFPPAMVTFPPGQTQESLTVTVKSEPVGAPAKSFLVNLLNATTPDANASIETYQAVGTINAPASSPTPTPTATPTTTPTPTQTTTPTPTSTPTASPTVTPVLSTGMFLTTGKGKKATHSDQLFFTAPLDPGSAQNAGNYRVTQKLSKKKTATVRVVTAMYSSGNSSVTLTLKNPAPGKPIEVAVSGLKGADGTPVTSFDTNL